LAAVANSAQQPEGVPLHLNPPTGRHTWLDPAWQAEIRGWAEQVLAVLGREIAADVEQPHVRPWSTVFKLTTWHEHVWLKATGPAGAHEGPLLDVFRDRYARNVLLPLAVHPERPWILFDDGGPTLRQKMADDGVDRDFDAWERILREYAALQRSLEADDTVAAMLKAGTPDGRPPMLIAGLERLLDDDVAWSRLTEEDREPGASARTALRDRLGRVRELATELGDGPILPSIQHDDFHDGNVLTGFGGDRFFDWGDASVAHPFATLTVTFNSIAHKTGLAQDDDQFVRLERAYLDAWVDSAPVETLQRQAKLARVFGCIGRSLSWERALAGLEPEDMEANGDAVAGWLMEFSERLNKLEAQ
jgi:hypothetical protein